MSKVISGISRGKVKKPIFVLLYGPDGVGKTSFGAEAPDSVTLGPEDGSSEIDTARFDGIKTFGDVRTAVKRLIKEDLGFKSLSVDSLDWLETAMHKEECKKQNKDAIEDCFGGYGKWVGSCNLIWRDFIDDLNTLREARKMNIILLAHSQVKAFNDPSQPAPYDRYMLKLNDKAAALWREAVDCVLFANFEVVTKKENKNDKKAKAYGEDRRIMYTQRRPSFDAKNRYGLPFELPLGWSHFITARDLGTPDSLEQVQADIAELLLNEKLVLKKPAMEEAIAKANGDLNLLIKIRNYARVLAETE